MILHKVMGTILDSPSVNRTASEDLEAEFYSWICLLCQAHGLSLFMKHLALPTQKEEWLNCMHKACRVVKKHIRFNTDAIQFPGTRIEQSQVADSLIDKTTFNTISFSSGGWPCLQKQRTLWEDLETL
jgi:hypothetical protein